MGLIDLDSTISSSRSSGNNAEDIRKEIRGRGTRGMALGTSPLQLVRAIFVVTGMYQDVVRRSYDANLHDINSEKLEDAIYNFNSNNAFNLASISNDILKPKAEIDKEIKIVNGWDEPRVRFYIELVRVVAGNTLNRYCYTGYTDEMGVTQDGLIDPEMTLHFTGLTVLQESKSDAGRITTRIIRDTLIMVADSHYSRTRMEDIERDRFGRPMNREYTLDPLSIESTYASMSDLTTMTYDGRVVDPQHASVTGSFEGKRLSRGLNIPGHYMGALVNAHRATVGYDDYNEPNTSIFNEYEEIQNPEKAKLSRAISFLDRDSDEDPLFDLYMEESNIRMSSTLRFGELNRYIDGFDDERRIRINFPEQMRQVSSMNTMSALRDIGQETLDADNWYGANIETIIATALCQQLPNLMLSELIEYIEFTVTNEVSSRLHGDYSWIIGDERHNRHDNRNAIMFVTNLPDRLERTKLFSFQQKIEKILLDPYTMNGNIPVSIRINCDVQGECTVVIAVDGGQDHRFVMPTFADAMSTPILTTDVDHYNQFSRDMVGLVAELTA